MLTPGEIAQLTPAVPDAPDGLSYWERRLAEISASRPAKVITCSPQERPQRRRPQDWESPAWARVLDSLRDGRARFEGCIRDATGLGYVSVARILRRQRRQGLVERIEIGPAILWALTCPQRDEMPADDAGCVGAGSHVSLATHTTGRD